MGLGGGLGVWITLAYVYIFVWESKSDAFRRVCCTYDGYQDLKRKKKPMYLISISIK